MGNESVALRSLELDGRENLPLEGEGVRGSFVGRGPDDNAGRALLPVRGIDLSLQALIREERWPPPCPVSLREVGRTRSDWPLARAGFFSLYSEACLVLNNLSSPLKHLLDSTKDSTRASPRPPSRSRGPRSRPQVPRTYPNNDGCRASLRQAWHQTPVFHRRGCQEGAF